MIFPKKFTRILDYRNPYKIKIMSVYLTIEKDDIRFKINLRNLAFLLIGSIIIADSLIILSNPHSREPIVIILLDVTAAIALSLGILVICRLKFHEHTVNHFFVLHWVYYCGSLPTLQYHTIILSCR